jgi:hypothetical protein
MMTSRCSFEIESQLSTLSDGLPHRDDVYSDDVQPNFFRCMPPCSSSLFQNHLHSRSSPSSVCFHQSHPFGQDRPNNFASHLSSLPSAGENLPLTKCSIPPFHPSLRNIVFFDELESELVDSSLLQPNRNIFSVSSFAKPFDHRSQLSYCVPFGIDVVPGDLAIETLLSNGADADSMPIEPKEGLDAFTDVSKILFHFKKKINGKIARLSDVTEVLFDDGLAESAIGKGDTLSLPKLDVDQILPLTEVLCAPLSCSGRSKISKLQHEVLNTWFYSHLNHP